MKKGSKWKIEAILIALFFALHAPYLYGASIGVVISPYGGITDTPCFVDVYGDGSKKILYTSTTINPDETNTAFLVLTEPDGTDLAGWPYEFPRGEYCSGGAAICDIDSDGKEEIIVKGSGSSGLFCRVFKHTENGPAVLYDIPIMADGLNFSDMPFSFWTSHIAAGDIDNNGSVDIIAYQNALGLNGAQKSLVEGLDDSVFVLGTPMLIEDEDDTLIVFHAAEVPDITNPDLFTHALYCIRLEWESPNHIIWRVEIGESIYCSYRTWSWGELGAADIDGDSHPEVVATAGINNIFEQRIIGVDGTILSSFNFNFSKGFSCDYDDHTRFVIADIGNENPAIILFPSYNSFSDYYNTPQSQPACVDIDGDGAVDLLLRGYGGFYTPERWIVQDCFFKVSPDPGDQPPSPYEPLIYPLSEDNIEEVFVTAANHESHHAWYLSHLALADLDSDGTFTLAGVMPDGSGLDIVNFGTSAPDTAGWRQAYRDGYRANAFLREGDEISIELTKTDWKFTIGLEGEIANFSETSPPEHRLINKGSIPIDIDIGYVGTTDCSAGYEPGIDIFAMVFGSEPSQVIPPDENIIIYRGVEPSQEEGLPLVYYSPTGLTRNTEGMKAALEIRAYKSDIDR
ncbi:MAG: hypothetical protein ISS34_07675 [Candidatus Omnitrophica bacterium]|nr:hypothetical protein [Candidatus Omnitrophota bacterium]